MSAKQVLDTAQALYERHKLLTYPRSDCRYLPVEHWADRNTVIDALASNCQPLAQAAQDAGDYTNTSDVNFRFLPCLASGLAYYLSLKFAADRVSALKAIYEEDFLRAAMEDRDTASVQFVPDLGV